MSKEFKLSLQRAGCYIVSQANCGSDGAPRGRMASELAPAQGVLVAGTVLAEDSVSGLLVQLDPTGGNNTNVVKAILFDTRDTGGVGTVDPVKCVIDTSDMAVHGGYLVFVETLDQVQLGVAISELNALGITVRNESDIATLSM